MEALDRTASTSSRAVRTRLALVGAGRQLFAAHPVEGVTIDDIVNAAGVAKGTFYTHFADRDDLERTIVLEIRAFVERSVLAANAGVGDPADRIARAMCVYFRYAIDEREGATVLGRMHGNPRVLSSPLNHGLSADIRTGIQSGRLTVATVESGALFVLGVTHIGLLKAVDEPSLRAAATTAQHLCELVLRGFGLTMLEAGALAVHASDRIIKRSKKLEKNL